MSKIYKCVCGKEFTNPQSFNGHKRQCSEHYLIKYGNLEKFNEVKETHQKACQKSAQKMSIKAAKNKQKKLNDWISDSHKCEFCGKVMTEYYGSGRFCNQSCANTRRHSEQTKVKTSKLVKDKLKKSNKQRKPKNKKISKTVLKGVQLAEEIGLAQSPYCEYNTAFERIQVGNRKSYRLSLYEGNKCVKYTTVLVYRYIMACVLGRKLLHNEVVHHIDGDETNNNLDNLVVMTAKEHNALHAKENKSFSQSGLNRVPWNKGKKMNKQFRDKMRQIALQRHKKNKGK